MERQAYKWELCVMESGRVMIINYDIMGASVSFFLLCLRENHVMNFSPEKQAFEKV